MDFTNKEKIKIKKDEVFSKIINKEKYWIKPLKDYPNYPEGDIKSHKKYFQYLHKYISNHIPKTIIFAYNPDITLIIQKHIKGKKPKSLKELKRIINEKQNNEFQYGIKKLLKEKNLILDLFIYKDNIKITKEEKIYYIDGRMPIFSIEKEKRYQISKKRTLFLLNK